MNFKILLLSLLIVTVLNIVTCNEKKGMHLYNLLIEGELYGFYWEGTKTTHIDFFL